MHTDITIASDLWQQTQDAFQCLEVGFGRDAHYHGRENIIEHGIGHGDAVAEPQHDEQHLLATAIKQAVAAALAVTPHDFRAPGEISVYLTDDHQQRAFNRRYRNRDRSTNVLSFPQLSADKIEQGGPLGDVVLAYETVASESRAQNIPFIHHVMHLIIHGVFHLLGYDHEEDGEALAMQNLERDALGRLGIADPYRQAELVE